MSELKVHVLGSGSATPTVRRQTSCQVVEHRGRLFMVDCGEGAQMRFRLARLKFSRLRHIFLSHLHGDHCLGLPGLISTMALQGCDGVVTVHTFREGREMFEPLLEKLCPTLPFRLEWDEIEPGTRGVVVDEESFEVETFPLRHRVPCQGYLFREKRMPRRLRGDMAEFYGVPHYRREGIRRGEDFVTADGRVIANERLTEPGVAPLSYAYASDTLPSRQVAESVRGVSLLYHEATYGHELAGQARERGHSTAAQAAEIARAAGVGALMLGHFSKRYSDVRELLTEARAIFPATIAAEDGEEIDMGNVLT